MAASLQASGRSLRPKTRALQLETDTKKVTSVDVALTAGVSQSTVSRAFDPSSRISEETRDLVIETARRLNYVPNSIARSLITSKSNLVALVLGDMRNPFYTSALDDFVHRFQEVGYSVVVLSVPRASEADSVVRKVLPYQVDGIVITAASISPQMGITCRDRRIPVVIFNRNVPGVHAHTVCCDNLDGGRMAADGLIQSGARSFAIIYGEQGAVNADRISGFKERLQAAGFDTSAIPSICGYTTFNGGYEAAIQLLSARSRPEAIFCTNDVMAFGAIEAARYGMSMRIPEDLSIIGFDGITDSARPSYSLSTIQQPVMQMIAEAVDIITSKRPDRLSSTTHFLKGTLVMRASTRNTSDRRAQTAKTASSTS
jgi:DNA-binding LacI/PurR family transcriptional regulator